MKKRLVFLGLIILALIGIIFIKDNHFSSGPVLKGIVETSIYAHYSEVSGKIIKLPIELGQVVKAGDVLVVLDDRNERYALEQLQETLVKKKAVLAELSSGVDLEELRQCQNNVSLAEIAYENAQLTRDRVNEDYEDVLALWEAGAIAQSELEKTEYQLKLAEATSNTAAIQLDNALQKLALMQKGTPQEKIDAAKADVVLTEVQIRQTEDNLAKYTITALHDGTVLSKNFLLGNIVSPGYNLVDIASEIEKHLVIYVPKKHLPKIRYGQEVVMRSGGKEDKGTISFIDVKAQYTPKDMQTSANKNKLSMKVKVNLAPGTPLKVGEEAEVVIP